MNGPMRDAEVSCVARRPSGSGTRAAAAVALLALLVGAAIGCAPKPNTVTVHDLAFDPADLTVPVGKKVTWVIDEQTAVLPQAVGFGTTSTPAAQQWSAPQPLNPGETFTHTFDKPGVYPYIDAIQPYCEGTVTVQ
jgi:plastocyanin